MRVARLGGLECAQGASGEIAPLSRAFSTIGLEEGPRFIFSAVVICTGFSLCALRLLRRRWLPLHLLLGVL